MPRPRSLPGQLSCQWRVVRFARRRVLRFVRGGPSQDLVRDFIAGILLVPAKTSPTVPTITGIPHASEQTSCTFPTEPSETPFTVEGCIGLMGDRNYQIYMTDL